MVERMVKEGASVDGSDARGRTALARCCGRGDLAAAQRLRSAHGAGLERPDEAGRTALFHACEVRTLAPAPAPHPPPQLALSHPPPTPRTLANAANHRPRPFPERAQHRPRNHVYFQPRWHRESTWLWWSGLPGRGPTSTPRTRTAAQPSPTAPRPGGSAARRCSSPCATPAARLLTPSAPSSAGPKPRCPPFLDCLVAA